MWRLARSAIRPLQPTGSHFRSFSNKIVPPPTKPSTAAKWADTASKWVHTAPPPTERQFVTNLHGIVAKGLSLSVLTGYGCAYGCAFIAQPAAAFLPLLGVGFFGSIACIWKLDRYEKLEKCTGLLTFDEQDSVRTTFWLMCGAAGMILTPTLSMVDPWTVPLVLGVTGGMMAGFTAWARFSRANPMFHWQEPLLFGLCSLVAIDLAALISLGVLGANGFAETVLSIDLHAGLMLFTALSAYDTHVALQAYRSNPHKNVHLLAIDLFWSLLNFFIRLLALINKTKK